MGRLLLGHSRNMQSNRIQRFGTLIPYTAPEWAKGLSNVPQHRMQVRLQGSYSINGLVPSYKLLDPWVCGEHQSKKLRPWFFYFFCCISKNKKPSPGAFSVTIGEHLFIPSYQLMCSYVTQFGYIRRYKQVLTQSQLENAPGELDTIQCTQLICTKYAPHSDTLQA